jgi:hypothetical protein
MARRDPLPQLRPYLLAGAEGWPQTRGAPPHLREVPFPGVPLILDRPATNDCSRRVDRSTPGNGIVMLGSSRPDAPATRGGGGGIYVVVIDPDAHCARARDAGAEILREPFDTDYGSRDYSAKDPEGNVWHFGTYQPFAFDHETAAKTTA